MQTVTHAPSHTRTPQLVHTRGYKAWGSHFLAVAPSVELPRVVLKDDPRTAVQVAVPEAVQVGHKYPSVVQDHEDIYALDASHYTST